MSTFQLKIVTPDDIKFDGQAQKIIVRTVVGDICILAGHIDYVAPLGIGEAKIVDADGNEKKAACNSGFISVADGEVCVASTTFEWAEEIDRERAQASKEKSEQELSTFKRGEAGYALADARMRRALARLGVSGR